MNFQYHGGFLVKIIGIVSEYNPFHNGHLYQVQKSVQELGADGVVAVMSGNFVQRGYPAIFNKWVRAEMAVRGGVNLVIELPTYFATSSAEQFAKGAVELLNATGVIDYLSFGSEYDDLSTLKQIAELLVTPTRPFQEVLTDALKRGLSFPAARAAAIHHALPELHTKLDMNQSNVILVIEYLKALINLNSKIEPYLVKRQGNDYHDPSLNSPFVSATAIRKGYFEDRDQLFKGNWMPDAVSDIMLNTPFKANRIENYEDIILYAIRSKTALALSKVRDVNEGLENKILSAAIKAHDYSSLVDLIKSKRYTMTRINRILSNLLLGIDQEIYTFSEYPYFRILAFDETGKKIIRKMKKNTEVPILTNINKFKSVIDTNPLLQLDIRATDIYHLTQRDKNGGLDFLKKPFDLEAFK